MARLTLDMEGDLAVDSSDSAANVLEDSKSVGDGRPDAKGLAVRAVRAISKVS